MAAPLSTSAAPHSTKRKVDLAAPGVRGSRIRRQPPAPPAKEVSVEELRERERRRAIAGVTVLALVISLIIVGIAKNWGFTLAGFTIRL